MTTITKERLLTIKQWRETYGHGSNVVLPAEEAEELARIALASLEAEPLVPVMYKGMKLLTKEGLELIRDGIAEATGLEAMCMADALLSGAPAPVVPDERAAFNSWNNDENLPIAGVGAKNAAWLAWQARAELGHSLVVNSPGTPAGWISCSDAVPAEYCDVILRDDLGNVFPGSWDKVFCLTRGGNKMAFVDKDGVEVESSTHWMPLPEPPQEVNQ
ncbi:DUF551 domain-containing protein [Escherichia coli O4]|nr:DUF551 domain-containing protein [Escherichia coli]ELC3407655.1 DUF551 domain-containing protein [Escherichia coli]ELW7140690.1 DUF551 domain-containing protein [Escherichia coli]ELX2114653.1 DUF551 domain-containing protein [Escherichia coli]ELX2645591.1 DUF551 domain-containing protein [Escherichia coli]